MLGNYSSIDTGSYHSSNLTICLRGRDSEPEPEFIYSSHCKAQAGAPLPVAAAPLLLLAAPLARQAARAR